MIILIIFEKRSTFLCFLYVFCAFFARFTYVPTCMFRVVLGYFGHSVLYGLFYCFDPIFGGTFYTHPKSCKDSSFSLRNHSVKPSGFFPHLLCVCRVSSYCLLCKGLLEHVFSPPSYLLLRSDDTNHITHHDVWQTTILCACRVFSNCLLCQSLLKHIVNPPILFVVAK